jgi:hypothetical protein
MKTYSITVKTGSKKFSYFALALTSFSAFMAAADAQGETPCSITVIPVGAPK